MYTNALEKQAEETPIQDVVIIPLQSHVDERGSFTELMRASWVPQFLPIQWNLVHSNAKTLRGVHVHRNHWDYLIATSGVLCLGLFDCRAGSSTFKRNALVELTGDTPCAVVLPPGVAHGFYFPVDSTHVYAVSHYWDLKDELGCRYDDPGLGIPWPSKEVVISDRDRELPGLDQILQWFG